MSAEPKPTIVVTRRPPGRPKSENVAALEALLIGVARELFIANGYGATTMSAVAQAARVSKTTLYSRFPSKPALVNAIAQEQMNSWSVGVHSRPIPDYYNLEETLRFFADAVLRAAMHPDFKRLSRVLQSEAENFPELVATVEERYARGVRDLTEIIVRFAQQDDRPCRDPEAVAELFLLMLIGWVSRALATNRDVANSERNDWMRDAVRMFVEGRQGW